MKLCKDCKYYVNTGGHPECAATRKIDVVTGEEIRASCYYARTYGERCGEDAELWETRDNVQ